jgi:hypothetical protein
MSFIPNPWPDYPLSGWVEWKNMALRICRASGGTDWGFALFDGWSSKNEELYDPGNTEQCWDETKRSPPTRTGINKLRKIAREYGWVPGLYAEVPSYPDEGGYISDADRAKIRKVVREFLDALLDPKKYCSKILRWIAYDKWFHCNGLHLLPQYRSPVHLLQYRDGKPEPFVPPPINWACR